MSVAVCVRVRVDYVAAARVALEAFLTIRKRVEGACDSGDVDATKAGIADVIKHAMAVESEAIIAADLAKIAGNAEQEAEAKMILSNESLRSFWASRGDDLVAATQAYAYLNKAHTALLALGEARHSAFGSSVSGNVAATQAAVANAAKHAFDAQTCVAIAQTCAPCGWKAKIAARSEWLLKHEDVVTFSKSGDKGRACIERAVAREEVLFVGKLDLACPSGPSVSGECVRLCVYVCVCTFVCVRVCTFECVCVELAQYLTTLRVYHSEASRGGTQCVHSARDPGCV